MTRIIITKLSLESGRGQSLALFKEISTSYIIHRSFHTWSIVRYRGIELSITLLQAVQREKGAEPSDCAPKITRCAAYLMRIHSTMRRRVDGRQLGYAR